MRPHGRTPHQQQHPGAHRHLLQLCFARQQGTTQEADGTPALCPAPAEQAPDSTPDLLETPLQDSTRVPSSKTEWKGHSSAGGKSAPPVPQMASKSTPPGKILLVVLVIGVLGWLVWLLSHFTVNQLLPASEDPQQQLEVLTGRLEHLLEHPEKLLPLLALGWVLVVPVFILNFVRRR